MTTPIEEMIDKDTVIRAAGKMRKLNVGALPVKTDEHRLHGFISDRDIVVRVIAEGKDPETTRISEIMSKGIISCTADQTPEEEAAIMADAQVPVDRGGQGRQSFRHHLPKGFGSGRH